MVKKEEAIMEKLITGISGIFFLIAIFLYIGAYKHRTKEYPKLTIANTMKPKNWIPVWSAQKWFDKAGFRYHLSSTIFVILGCILYFILLTFIEK